MGAAPEPRARPEEAQAPYFAASVGAGRVTSRGATSFGVGASAGGDGARSGGIAASWSWNGRRLTVTNDRYGLIPLFYAGGPDRILISPSLATLVEQGAPAELDPVAITIFHRYTSFLGEDTPLRAVKVVPPDARFEWEPGRLTVEDRRFLGTATEISRDEAIETYAALFRQAVGRMLTDAPFGVPLSGGQDSRHILLELLAAGARPSFCLTVTKYPPDHSEDLEIARRLTRELGLPHVTPGRIPRFTAEYRKNAATHYCAFDHAWFIPAADYLRERVDVIYDGYCGDMLSRGVHQDRHRLDLYREGRLDELVDVITKGDDRRSSHPVLRLDPNLAPEEVEELARQRIVAELARYESAPNPIMMFFLWNRLRRAVALSTFGVFADIPTRHCPYLDPPLFDFLSSLDPELTIDGRFHGETIARAHPSFAEIPFARVGKTAPDRREYTRLAGEVAAYGVRRRPARLGLCASVAASWACYATSEAFRARHGPPPGPISLLHLWQLEDMISSRLRANSRASFRPDSTLHPKGG